MEHNGLTIQQCKDVWTALQLESQHWVPAFIYTGIHMEVTLSLQDVFEHAVLFGDSGEVLNSERGSRDGSDTDDCGAENLIDLTLLDD